jgi:3-phosphoshikimate 1-carboxyvinyltransferase
MASRVSGTVRASPSKSYTHRAIVLASLSGGPCRIGRPLRAEDTDATIEGMRSFGAEIQDHGEALVVKASSLGPASRRIDAKNSGTTLRFLTGVASVFEGTSILTGDASLRKRPMDPLIQALNGLGARARSLDGSGHPPVEIRGVLRGGPATIAGGVSSQFLSSLLIACPLARGDSTIRVLPPRRSEPYLAMTSHMIRAFRGDLQEDADGFRIRGGQTYHPVDIDVPGDFSSAAFPMVAAAITGGDVTVAGLDVRTPQGDSRIVDHLRTFGARVDVSGDHVRVRGGPLVGQTVDVGDTPDLFPVLAVLATQAEGETRFENGSHLRFKESNRIESVVSALNVLGANAKATADGCIVSGPTRLIGGPIDSRGDHRVLMAAAVAGLVAQGFVDISDPWCFRASYPSFLQDMRSLGALQAVVV